MIHDSRRTVYIVISLYPGPVPNINILQISKVHLVEISNLLKYIPPVDSGARTGRKHPARFFVAPDILAHAALEGPAEK